MKLEDPRPMDSPMRELGASLSATPGGNDVRLESGAQMPWRGAQPGCRASATLDWLKADGRG
jgi:hypothetical protein